MQRAKSQSLLIDDPLKSHIDTVLGESSKGILAVLLTSLLKKSITPAQDIRKHQSNMVGGYSGRTLDTNVTTPFLQDNYFPSMAESGWLTRSLEQNRPYNMDYSGSIRPKKLKMAFLHILDLVQKNGNPDSIIVYMLQEMIKQRDARKIPVTTPRNLRIDQIMYVLNKHFTEEYGDRGAARLPVLAIYAAYQQMVVEVNRYRGCRLKEMKPHTAADSRTGALGDVEIEDSQGNIFEAIEVKHGQAITKRMINNAYNKFRTEQIKRYYILTTYEDYDASDEVTNTILRIHTSHGCQVIVNGVMHTLRYYLRLLNSTDDFIKNYVELLKSDLAIMYEHKEKWNEIIGGNNP